MKGGYMAEYSMYQALLLTASLFISWIVYIVTGIACAYYVYQDAIKQVRRVLKIHPYWWAAFALMGGVWTLIAYWIMQHSTLVKKDEWLALKLDWTTAFRQVEGLLSTPICGRSIVALTIINMRTGKTTLFQINQMVNENIHTSLFFIVLTGGSV